jgi:hypothetical protein
LSDAFRNSFLKPLLDLDIIDQWLIKIYRSQWVNPMGLRCRSIFIVQ